jgi:hypothetical protein
MNFTYDRSIDSALDAFCAQLQYQDKNPNESRLLPNVEDLRNTFFPFFAAWFEAILRNGASISVRKNRTVAAMIGAAYALKLSVSDVPKQSWGDLVEFVRAPQASAKIVGIVYPSSKGRWDGEKGYHSQMKAMRTVLSTLVK